MKQTNESISAALGQNKSYTVKCPPLNKGEYRKSGERSVINTMKTQLQIMKQCIEDQDTQMNELTNLVFELCDRIDILEKRKD